jgi:hypothetical protein
LPGGGLSFSPRHRSRSHIDPSTPGTGEINDVSDSEALAWNRVKVRRRWELGAAILSSGALAGLVGLFYSILSR